VSILGRNPESNSGLHVNRLKQGGKGVMQIHAARAAGSVLLALLAALSFCPELYGAQYPAPGKGCIAAECHAGIEPIRAHESQMAQDIYKLGAKMGDPNGCVVCHGGNPAEEKDAPTCAGRRRRSASTVKVGSAR